MLTRIALCLCVLTFALPAQIEVGGKAPKIEVDEFLNTKIKSIKELEGQVLLLEYFAYW